MWRKRGEVDAYRSGFGGLPWDASQLVRGAEGGFPRLAFTSLDNYPSRPALGSFHFQLHPAAIPVIPALPTIPAILTFCILS